MKTIAINSIKGGTGKSTLSVLFVKSLIGTGYKCLVIDADASNNSLSFYFNDLSGLDVIQGRTIFDLFLGAKVEDCVIGIQDKQSKITLDLIRGDVRLNEFRSTDSLKRLKRALQGQPYDFCIIDTSPTYDNIIGNVLTASDVLLVPIQQDIFSYQALKYQLEKLADLELDDLDTHVIFNQFEKPLNGNQDTYRNQITNMFLENEVFRPFINPNHLSRSSVYRKYINKRNYQLSCKSETQNGYEEVQNLIESILGVTIEEAI